MWWQTLIGNPLVEISAVLGVIASLQKYGYDVWGGLATFLKLRKPREEINADHRDALQTVLTSLETRMDELSLHFNHDATDNQKRIEQHLETVTELSTQTVQLLREIKEYGIKCRKE